MQPSRYHVVEFSVLPYDTIYKYVCVPDDWIIWHVGADKEVVVAYPEEESSRTNERVSNNECHSKAWKMYRALRKYSTDTFDEAIHYIRSTENKTISPMALVALFKDINIEGSQNSTEERQDNFSLRDDFSRASTSKDVNVEVPERTAAKEEVENEQQEQDYEAEEPIANLGNPNDPSPLEHDRNDSKWTLKYCELAPGTGVYLNADNFEDCKSRAKNCNSLARELMSEIFRDSALRSCSLTGKRYGTDTKPGLDQNAVTALLDFVENYGRQQGWTPLDRHSIKNSMTYKLRKSR